MKILLIDIGNTHIHLGLSSKGRVSGASDLSPKDYRKGLIKLIKVNRPKVALICSVVPRFSVSIRRLLKANKVSVYECGREIKVPVKNLYRRPAEVGQDRLLGVYAAANLFKGVRLVVDLGTALTFDFISAKGAYLGGLIFPGVSVSFSRLLLSCALLPKKVKLKPLKKLQGRSTAECISSGVVFGYSFLIGGLVTYLRKQGNKPFRVVLTGGDARIINKKIAGITYSEPLLCLKGLAILAKKAIK